MTAREKADLEYKQRVYDLALERRKALEGLVDDGYSMPANYGMPILAFFIGSFIAQHSAAGYFVHCECIGSGGGGGVVSVAGV